MRKLIVIAWVALIGASGIAQAIVWQWSTPTVMYNWQEETKAEGEVKEFWIEGLQHLIQEWETKHLKPTAIKRVSTIEAITKRDIEEYRNRYGELDDQLSSINDRYKQKLSEAQSAEMKQALKTEQAKVIADIKRNFADYDYVRQKVLVERQKASQVALDSLRRNVSELYNTKELRKVFNGSLQDRTLNETLQLNDSREKDVLFKIEFYKTRRGEWMEEFAFPIVSEYEGTLYVTKQSLAKSPSLQASYDEYKQATQLKQWLNYGSLVGFAFSIISYAAFIRHIRFTPNWLIRIFAELRLILLVIGILATPVITYENTLNIVGYNLSLGSYMSHPIIDWQQTLATWGVLLVYGILLYVLMNSLLAVRWKEQTTLRLSELWIFKSPVLLGLFILFLTGVTGGCFGLIVGGTNNDGLLLVIFMTGSTSLMLFSYYIGYLNKIIRGALLAQRGHLVEDLPVRSRGRLGELAAAINELKNNVDISRGEQLKSERFKTELISNVSHDLRTPLTSIITYTDLLKQDDITAEERQEYLDIVDRKSQRLKTLIDDLFEVTKMSTGHVELHREEGDIVQLLQQALGEHSEALDAQQLQVRLTHSEKPINVLMDGDKMWRVFDNVLGNIVKYAQPQSRVYISLQATETNVVLQFKNMSHYELGDNVDELLERFKRGDTSRHTEGSGLGLAIVQTIVELHGGQFTLGVEGDLFKVTIELKR